MINSSPSSQITAQSDSTKRLRLTIPRNNKAEYLTNSNTILPEKIDEKRAHLKKKSLDCNNTMTTMKQQLSESIENENDTTLLTTTTTTTTVEFKVKTTKTSSSSSSSLSSSRKRKLNMIDDTINRNNNNHDNTNKQREQQPVNKKKVKHIYVLWNTIEAQTTERKFNLYFSFTRAASPRDNDILMCACMPMRSPYLLFSLHTWRLYVDVCVRSCFISPFPCPVLSYVSVCYSSLSSYNTYLKETE